MKLTSLAAALLLCLPSLAQQFKELPSFGKVDKAELEMKECSFEKSAGAMVIFSEAESFFKIDLNASVSPVFEQTEHRVRIKIFNEKGFGSANIKIIYPDDKMISIKKFSAQTYNLDAGGNIVVTKVDDKSVFDKKLNKRFYERTFAFPAVKAGSIIEYKYILDGESESQWYFQQSIPVEYSRFVLNFPAELIMSVTPYTNLPVQQGKDYKSGNNYSWYAMENIPPLNDEPYMSCREDYLQRLEARLVALDFAGSPRQNLLRTWPGIIKELVEDEDFGKQLKKDIPRTADLDKMLQAEANPYRKMNIVHNYVRNNMQWNNYNGIWALDGVKSAWRDKKGTSGEINLILINLLKDAGLDVHPILVSTRSNGIINTSVAGYSQFDKVMAYVDIDNKTYILDATEKNTPSFILPYEVMASEGLLIDKLSTYGWGWKTIWDDKHIFRNNVFVQADLDEKGNMKGTATISSYDYEKIQQLAVYRKGMDYVKKDLQQVDGLSADSILVENAEVDSLPLIVNCQFESKGSASGEYKYFSSNLFSGLTKNHFIADERSTDIFFGANQLYEINGTYFLPDGYTMEVLPKNLRMIMPDTSIVFIRQASYSDGILSVKYVVEFKSPLFVKDSYPEFKEFYKKLFSLLNEKFVYKKKA